MRDTEEYAVGHLPGSRHVPDGQLVQEDRPTTPACAARIVLVDNDGVRASMAASWLAQLGWDVAMFDGLQLHDFSAAGRRRRPPRRFRCSS